MSQYVKQLIIKHIVKSNTTGPAVRELDSLEANKIKVLNDAKTWTKIIHFADEATAKIIESSAFSILRKAEHKLQFGTVNVQ